MKQLLDLQVEMIADNGNNSLFRKNPRVGLKAGSGSASIMAASLALVGLGLIALDRPPRGTAL